MTSVGWGGSLQNTVGGSGEGVRDHALVSWELGGSNWKNKDQYCLDAV